MPSCSIIGCGLSYTKGKKITLHKLPHNEELRKKWLKAICGLKVNGGHKNIHICSDHFEDSFFNKTLSVVRLREDAVPTIFDPKLMPRTTVKRTHNGEPATLNPQVKLVDCTKSTSFQTNTLPVNKESNDVVYDNNDDSDGGNDDDHDTGSDDSTSPVQKKSFGNQKLHPNITVMDEEAVITPVPCSAITVDPLKIQKLKQMRAFSSYEKSKAAMLISKLREKNLAKGKEIKKLNQKVQRQLNTISKLRGSNGPYKDSVDISSSTKPVVIGYVCDDVTDKTASSGEKMQYLDQKDLKLRRVNNRFDNPVFEFVNDDEKDKDKEDRDKTQNAPSNAKRSIRKLDNEFWQLKLSYILHKTEFCGLCLNAGDELNDVSDELEMHINGTTHSRTLLDIVDIIFKEAGDVLSNSKICNNCKTSLIESYIFNENIKKTSKMLNYHLNELYNKTCYIQNTVLNDPEHPTIRNAVFSLEPLHKEVNTGYNKQEDTETIEDKPNFFKCMKCDISLQSYRKWKEHKQTHKTKKNNQCRICNHTFNTPELLTNHFTVHFTTKCRICHGLVQDGGLLTHLKRCHMSSIHLCKKCDVVYYSNEDLEAHNRLWHCTGVTCVTCRRSFTQQDLAIHKCRFACPDRECDGSPCVHHKYLMSFREQILSQASMAKCPECHYVTSSLARLIKHANNVHLLKFATVEE